MLIKFDKYVLINGSKVFIHSDVMTCLKIIELLPEGQEIKPKTLAKVLALFFRDNWQNHVDDKSFKAMTEFLFKKLDEFDHPKSEKTLDIIKDFDAIYSGILRVYKVDIIEEKIHWWKFLLMLADLGDETSIAYRMKMRGTNLSSIKDPAQKAEIAKVKNVFRLTKKLSLDERNKRWRG